MARQREARVALAQATAMYGDEYEVRDPGEVLVAAVADVDAIVQKLKQQVQQRQELTGTDLLALGDWLDRASKMAKAVLDARVDERRVQLSERQGALVAGLLRAIFADPLLALSSTQVAVAPSIAARHLRALASGEQHAIEAGGTR